MKRFLFTVLCLTGLGVFAGCATVPDRSLSTLETANPAIYRKISAEEANKMMGDGQPLVLLDVRTQEEFATQRIAGAILIPDNELAKRANTELPDKSARILIYCRSGRRSALAAKALVDMGYAHVYDFGGILEWPYDKVSD